KGRPGRVKEQPDALRKRNHGIEPSEGRPSAAAGPAIRIRYRKSIVRVHAAGTDGRFAAGIRSPAPAVGRPWLDRETSRAGTRAESFVLDKYCRCLRVACCGRAFPG